MSIKSDFTQAQNYLEMVTSINNFKSYRAYESPWRKFITKN